MRRLAVASLVTSACAALALLAIAVAPGCGPSQLSKQYAAYDARADAILERQKPVWQRLMDVMVEQHGEEAPDIERCRTVFGEAAPFYEALKGEVAAAAPAQPELATAHELLLKFADRRAAFARVVAGGVDILFQGDPWRDLDAKDAALRSAMLDYAQRIQGRLAPPDPRYHVIENALKDFQRLCVEPLGNGRLTADQVSEIVKTRIQPKVREARASQFEDDEEGRSIRAAVFAADAFLDAMPQSAALMESRARMSAEVESLGRESEELYTKFKDEMKAVRGRM